MILSQGYDKVPADYIGKVWIEGQVMEMLTEFYNQLAASQAREEVLRAWLLKIASGPGTNRLSSAMEWAHSALEQPTDDAALKSALAAERERLLSIFAS